MKVYEVYRKTFWKDNKGNKRHFKSYVKCENKNVAIKMIEEKFGKDTIKEIIEC